MNRIEKPTCFQCKKILSWGHYKLIGLFCSIKCQIDCEGNKMKYRKKPIVIEAYQYNGCVVDIAEKFLDMKVPRKDNDCCYIETLEGLMKCEIGDYIIRGIKGEFYPCKADIFEMTYEVVE